MREPVRESVGDLEHETANKKRKKKVREPSKQQAGKWREFTRIKERIFFEIFFSIKIIL